MNWRSEEIKARVSIEDILRHYGAQINGKGLGRCLFHERHHHGDADPSMSVQEGRVRCWSQGCFGDKGADIFELVGIMERHARFADQKRRVLEIAGLNGYAPPPSRHIAATYDYTDESGTLLFQVVRYEPKTFRQRRPDGQNGWIWNLKDTPLVLYRLPDVHQAESILLLEGEKDVETAFRLGLPAGWAATCNPMGASKWRKEYSEYLRGKDVVILPDGDEPGHRHVEMIEAALCGIARSIRRIELSTDAKDLTEWAEGGGTPVSFIEWLRVDPRCEMGIPVSTPILDAVHRFLGRFLVYPSPHAHVAHTLWCVHTHVMAKWESTPRIAFLSPEPGSGKSRALEVTETLVPRPMQSINATAAALFRKVSDPKGPPTILYDEIDTIFGPKAKEHEDIRALINAGHRRGALAHRCAVKGKQIELEEFPAYCAVALAGLGHLPDTILTRSIVIRMRRRAPNERIEPYRRRHHAPEGYQLRDQIADWARKIEPYLNVDPAMPAGIADRDADVWESLLSLADAAGGDWPDQARVAAVTLVTDSKGDRGSLGVRLLADLRTVFDDKQTIATTDILDGLVNLEESPWGDLRGKPLDARRLSQLLKPYDISPKPVRIGANVFRGYERADLHDAWVRYLPAESKSPLAPSPIASVTSVTNITDED